MDKKYFEDYGDLEWLEAEDFYAGNWSIHEAHVKADDGDEYTIVISGDNTELRYTIV